MTVGSKLIFCHRQYQFNQFYIVPILSNNMYFLCVLNLGKSIKLTLSRFKSVLSWFFTWTKHDIILTIDKMIYKMYTLEIPKNGKADFEMFLKLYSWILFSWLGKICSFFRSLNHSWLSQAERDSFCCRKRCFLHMSYYNDYAVRCPSCRYICSDMTSTDHSRNTDTG